MKRVHLVGIGGIGVSAIARMFLAEGKEVSGSDQSPSPITEELARLGAKIFYGHRAKHLAPGTDLVVHSIAIPPLNPELVRAKELGILTQSYPEILGELSKDKYTVAVAGTHGKTTTTAMLAKIFLEAGLDPTVIIGSLLLDQRSNFIAGQSQYLIVEACEYRRSFLHLRPKILVITNIDNDHLDYYRDLTDIQSAFAELVVKVPADGYLICDKNNERLVPILQDTRCRVVDYRAGSANFRLRVPGRHNILNAQAATAAAAAAGIAEKVARQALSHFNGSWRRFEYKGKTKNGALIYDDYAHHPTEIKATLAAAREICQGRVIVVFQPHLFSRTKLLFPQFITSFAEADEVIITDIYAAREPPDPTVSGADLAAAIAAAGKPARYFKDRQEIVFYLQAGNQTGGLILTMGAGDIFDLAEDLL